MLTKIREFLDNKKVFILLMSIMSVTLILFILISYSLGAEGRTLTGKKFAEYWKLAEVNEIMEEKNIKALEKTLLSTFNKKQLTQIVRSELDYSMVLNDKKFPIYLNAINIDTPRINIKLYEYFGSDAIDILPKSIIDIGSMFNKRKDLKAIKISVNKAKYKMKRTEISDGRLIEYDFYNLKNGEIITLEIDPMITKKSGLKNGNVIEIFYTKAAKKDEDKK